MARPCSLREANDFVERLHRHNSAVQGHRFSIAAVVSARVVGVVIVGRPTNRWYDQTHVAEVTRLCTDGTRNACSFLYSRAAKTAQAMGFERIQTYTLESEPGGSLRAAGWEDRGVRPSKPWAQRPDGRTRRNAHDTGPKRLWWRVLNDRAVLAEDLL